MQAMDGTGTTDKPSWRRRSPAGRDLRDRKSPDAPDGHPNAHRFAHGRGEGGGSRLAVRPDYFAFAVPGAARAFVLALATNTRRYMTDTY